MKNVEIEMEIPKNCRECPMNKGEYSPDEIEKRYCCLTHKSFSIKDYKKHPTECPIKEKINLLDFDYKIRQALAVYAHEQCFTTKEAIINLVEYGLKSVYGHSI